MSELIELFSQNIIAIYFFYGLAFFGMGLAILVESGRTSEFPLALALAPLAGFGIIHGLHEWLEMFQLLNRAGATTVPPWLLNETLRIAHLTISFVLLIVFGVQLVYASHRNDGRERLVAYVAGAVLLTVWLLSFLITRWLYDVRGDELVSVADVLARYILAIPGALLAAWAIVLEQRTFKARGMSAFGRALLGAAVALVFYGVIGQIFPRPSFLFPSNILNSQTFLTLTGFPIQLFRTACALVMAFFIVRALRAFEWETQQRLLSAQEARDSAQQQMLATQAQARGEVEQLNQELQEAVRNLSSLYTFSRNLVSTLDQQEILEQAIPEFVEREPHIRASIVFLRERSDRPLEPVVKTQCPTDAAIREVMLRQAYAVGHFVAQNKQPAWWNGTNVAPLSGPEDLTLEELDTGLPGSTAGRTLGIPLLVSPQTTGSLVVCTEPGLPPFTGREFSLVSTAAGQLSTALHNAALYQEIREKGALLGELLHKAVSAQEQERQRIARELHDGTGQKLTALGLGLAATSGFMATDEEMAARQLIEMRKLADQALTELHEIIADLRPSVLDDLGLVPALHGQIRAFEARSGIHADLEIVGPRIRLQPELEIIVFRIVQEALTNIIKHASARSVNVKMVTTQDSLQVAVSDDGAGFEPERALDAAADGRRAWGLLGMQERVALAGGTFSIHSAPAKGTTIRVTIPLRASEEEKHEQDQVASGR